MSGKDWRYWLERDDAEERAAKKAGPHVLDDPGLAGVAKAIGIEWRACTSFGRAWGDLLDDEREEIRESTRHLVDDEILAVALWRRV